MLERGAAGAGHDKEYLFARCGVVLVRRDRAGKHDRLAGGRAVQAGDDLENAVAVLVHVEDAQVAARIGDETVVRE